MTHVTTAKGSFIFVEVPDDAYYFNVMSANKENWDGNYLIGKPDVYELIDRVYKNNWIIIPTTKDITEEQASELVEDCPFYAKCWKRYNIDTENDYGDCPEGDFNSNYSCWTAKESLQSLIQSVGLDTTKTYLILKKQ